MRWIILLLFSCCISAIEGHSKITERSPALQAAIDSMSKYMDAGNFEEAEKWLNEARVRLGAEPHQKDYFSLRYNEGNFYLKKWQLEAAEPVLLECLQLARKSADSTQLVMANAMMSQLKAEQSLYGASIVYGNEALDYSNSADSLQYYGLTSNISISYMHEHNMEKALEYALAAKSFYERNAHYLELGLTLNNIGEVYREQFTDYEMAEKHYRKAIAINKKHGFKSGLAANYLNLALTFDIREQIDSAFHYANLAKNIRFETGDIGGLAIIHNALGQINLHDGDFQAARKAFSETIRISKEHQIYPGLFYGNWGLGETYSAKGAHNIAKEYYEIALATAERLKSKPMIADTHQSLYELERELGDFQSALNHFELYKSYSDSIRMKQNENEFAELKTIYETDLAHTENMLLKATQESQNAELRRQRTTAIGLWVLLGLVVIIAVILYIGYDRRSKSLQKEAALNQELQKQYHTVNLQKEELKKLDDLKNKIFSVLGHDLRAPLTSISSLMRLIHSKHLDAQEFARLTEHLDNETRAGLTSLQNILDWSQIKAGNEKTQIEELSVGPIINEFLINNRRQLDEKNIEVSTNWDETPTITADKNQFKSITTNLISNAIKFSPPGGKIYLQTIRESKGVRFIVRDTGEGISDDLITKLNSNEKIVSKRGTSGEKGTGIGLRIAKDFAELHGGRLTFKNADGGGTAVEVFFPSEVKHFKVSA